MAQQENIDIYRILSNDKDYIEVQLEVIGETEKAICFNVYNGHLSGHEKKCWIPKSQTKEVTDPDFGRRMFVKTWLATKNHL